MLLTDGNPNTTEDLRTYESAILSVANGEQIDLSVKLSLATEEIAQEVLDVLGRREAGVSDVAVTRQMKRWHALHTLEIVYRDAFHNQLNDRYKAKFFEYRRLASQAKTHTMQWGIGLVARPLPVAETPVITYSAAPVESATYFVRVAWVGADGREGLASPVTTYETPAGRVPVVAAVEPPAGAAGYHVYMGMDERELKKQTSTPVEVGEAFTMIGGALVEGPAPGDGQAPDSFVTSHQVLRRG